MSDVSTPPRTGPPIAALLLDHAPSGVALVEGEDFTFTYVNAAFQAISPDRPMLGRPFAVVWPEVAERIVPMLQRLRAGGAPVELLDFRADVRRRVDGPLEEAWWNVHLKALPPRAGEPAPLAIHALDRTAAATARQAERTLADEQARVEEAQRAAHVAERVAEAIPQLVWTCTPAGETDWTNQRWRDYTGLPPGPQHGDPWRAVLHEHDAPRWLNRWMTALRAGLPVDLEARLRGADGSHRWHLLRAVPLHDDQGRVS